MRYLRENFQLFIRAGSSSKAQSSRKRNHQDIRSEIASYIRDKRSMEWILEKLTSKYMFTISWAFFLSFLILAFLDKFDASGGNEEDFFQRHNCATRDDIRNVVASLGLTLYEKDRNDAVSVDLLVKESEGNEKNPFFYYNPQSDQNSVFTLGKLAHYQNILVAT